jgi:hypothetical protein
MSYLNESGFGEPPEYTSKIIKSKRENQLFAVSVLRRLPTKVNNQEKIAKREKLDFSQGFLQAVFACRDCTPDLL